MLRPLWLLLLLVAASGPLAGCDTHRVAGPVDGRFVVSLYSAAGPPQFLIATEEPYSCLLPLALDVDRVERDEVRVEVLGIGETDACATAIGPARGVVPLPQEEGDYRVALVFDSATDLYEVEVRSRGTTLVGLVTRFSRLAE